jgi:Flp pilus assembly protein TadD
MKRAAIHAVIIAAFAAGAASAADSPGGPAGAARDPALEQAREAIAAGNWAQARQVMRQALAADPRNPDYHNLFAYAVRKGPNPDLNVVFKHYHEALRLDARHRGAHEYVGEAYLMVGNLAKAKEHLAALDRLCFLPCEEYNLLKKAVAEFEAKQKH